MLEQRQEPACFSAGTQCVLTSVCQGLRQGQKPAWFSTGTVKWVQEYLSGLDHGQTLPLSGQTLPLSGQKQRWGLRSTCWGNEQGPDLDWFSAGTEMQLQEYVLG